MSKTLLPADTAETTTDAGPADTDAPDAGTDTRDEVSGRATSVNVKVRSADAGGKAYRQSRAEVEPGQSMLATIRKARSLARATIAETMEMDENEVSRLERHADLYLSTFRRFVQATGGELRLAARYPDREIEVTIGEPATGSAAPEARK